MFFRRGALDGSGAVCACALGVLAVCCRLCVTLPSCQSSPPFVSSLRSPGVLASALLVAPATCMHCASRRLVRCHFCALVRMTRNVCFHRWRRIQISWQCRLQGHQGNPFMRRLRVFSRCCVQTIMYITHVFFSCDKTRSSSQQRSARMLGACTHMRCVSCAYVAALVSP